MNDHMLQSTLCAKCVWGFPNGLIGDEMTYACSRTGTSTSYGRIVINCSEFRERRK